MSNPYLPQEILDDITDILHNDRDALKRCCLVSKSWVPRTQKHLSADIKFKFENYDKWKKTFPDPTNSPAHHTHILTVEGSLLSAVDDSWIQGFSYVEELIVNGFSAGSKTAALSFAPFHRLAPSLTALYLSFMHLPYIQTFDLIGSLPLLENLGLTGDKIITNDDDESDGPDELPNVVSPIPQPLSGALEVFLSFGTRATLRRLLDLPGGLHFRELDLSWYGGRDLPNVAEMVVACSDTLEHLQIMCTEDGGIVVSLSDQTITHIYPKPYAQIQTHRSQLTFPKPRGSEVYGLGTVP